MCYMDSKQRQEKATTSLVTSKMQVKTIIYFDHIIIMIAKIKDWTIPSVVNDVMKLEPSYISRGKIKWYKEFEHLWKIFKTYICIYHTMKLFSLYIYSWKIKEYIHKKTSTPIFIATLFVVAQTGSKPNVYQEVNRWNVLLYLCDIVNNIRK